MSRTTANAVAFKQFMEEQRRDWCHSKHDKTKVTLDPKMACSDHKIIVNWEVVGSDGKSIQANSDIDHDKRKEETEM